MFILMPVKCIASCQFLNDPNNIKISKFTGFKTMK